jgi:Glycogen recognition site of AMP-activated protein kinase
VSPGRTMSDEIDRATKETRAFLDARPSPDVRPAVMRRIEELAPSGSSRRPRMLERVAIFLWAPREISIRPAFALVGVGAALILGLVSYRGEVPPVTEQVANRGAPPQVFVQFRLEAAASRVQLAGSFTNWEPRYELLQYAPGAWTITVPLSQGVHDYAFVVDGREWVPDPYAPQIGDGFGGTNSRLTLLSPDTPQL